MALKRAVEARARTLAPIRIRRALQHLYYATLDGFTYLAGQRDPLVPPRTLLRISTSPASDYKATGLALVDFLVEHCGLRPDQAVLDVGCGVGRLAVALTGFLDASGRYQGFDVVPAEIEWCQRHVSARDSRFTFQLADLANQVYHPEGRTRASEYRFPYTSETFDLAVVASVFTHIFAADVEQYVSEIARVLKPGGRCLASFYLLNERSRRLMEQGASRFTFRSHHDGCFVEDARHPETAVAYDEHAALAWFAAHGLTVRSVLAGSWPSSRDQSQDLVVVEKPGD